MHDIAKTTAPARRTGAIPTDGDSIQWRVWAPFAKRVELVLRGERRETLPMDSEGDGYFTRTKSDVPEGQLYTYRLNGKDEPPDPCSLWQPDGVTGPSAVVRPGTFKWTDDAWKGVGPTDLVIYELHVGTFTPQG